MWSVLAAGAMLLGAGVETPAAPEGFTRFEIPGHEEEATLLSDYLWYHFHHRGGNGLVLFNLEYLAVSDLWLNAAVDRGSGKSIQEVHRDQLLAARVDASGYVETHQHFSHAHDQGWPFPMWVQADGHERLKGKVFGWHFQPLERVPHWTGDNLRAWKGAEWCGDAAVAAWGIENARSEGIVNDRWRVAATGASPTLVSPEGYGCEAYQAPFLQLRWTRTGQPAPGAQPYIEWMREEDADFSPGRRVYLYHEKTALSSEYFHSIAEMYRHPEWQGKIKRLRLSLAPGESEVQLDIDSFFTVYDTRHTINNPIFILASYWYFVWTQDLDFLRKNMPRMRAALRYQQTELGALEHKVIRNTWPGHEGLAGWSDDAQGNRTVHGGQGIGSNYWDLLPFGWDDCYATNQYHAAALALADLEAAIVKHPGWNIPAGGGAFEAGALRAHAAEVKARANELFWNAETGRFVACVDKAGQRHDYGFTFLSLDAIWYGLASDEHARAAMDWISGARIVPGDTSTGADIYRWRFGPRATTLRNVTWYAFPWTRPEHIPWGGQVQDGGAVLGFTFYDLMARLKVYGPENAWQRLREILAWEKEVRTAGGYRAYYADGKQGTTLQGGGTAGGLGIDHEFYESSLLPAFVVYGLGGLTVKDAAPVFAPKLPAGMRVTVRDLKAPGGTRDVEF